MTTLAHGMLTAIQAPSSTVMTTRTIHAGRDRGTNCTDSDTHGSQREAHPSHHALQGDPPRTPGDCLGLTQPVQPIEGEDQSAASDAAVAPRAPRATPTSARASAWASLMPSPTIMVGARCVSSLTMSSFSLGERSANTSSTPITAPTVLATSVLSPVTITMRVIPLFRNQRRVRAASGRRGSSKTNTPAGSPSMPTKRVRAPSRAALRRADRAQVSAPVIPVQDAFPTVTWWPETVPRMPWPGISRNASSSPVRRRSEIGEPRTPCHRLQDQTRRRPPCDRVQVASANSRSR